MSTRPNEVKAPARKPRRVFAWSSNHTYGSTSPLLKRLRRAITYSRTHVITRQNTRHNAA